MTRQGKMVFCTLFDTNYMDKGLALYWSMKKNISVFKLYIFAFDSRCYEIISAMQLENTIVLSLEDIMTERLRQIQYERTRAEFCWTCTPLVIEYVLSKKGEMVCTYVDADVYFFADPIELIQEIMDENCSVGLTAHRFERNSEYGRHVFEVGKYCIQFNTFFQDKNGMQVLRDWKECCLEWCYGRFGDGRYGDQKYPDEWGMKYCCVHESQNLGAGIAPWNLHLCNYVERKAGNIWMNCRGKRFRLLFYHFEGIKYFDDGSVYLNLWYPGNMKMHTKVYIIYGEYFQVVERIRKHLEKRYGVTFRHMFVDKKSFHGTYYTLGRFAMEHGMLAGLNKWIGYWSNNIVKVKKLRGEGNVRKRH